MPDPEEHLNIVQAIEQMRACLRDLAPALAQYHRRLVDEGMTRNEATFMTAQMQEAIFRGGDDDSDPEWKQGE